MKIKKIFLILASVSLVLPLGYATAENYAFRNPLDGAKGAGAVNEIINENHMQNIWAEPNNNIPANNQDLSIVYVEISKRDGTPVNNKEVEWNTNSGILSSQKTMTNEDGVAEVQLKNEEEGNARVTANFEDSQMSTDIAFVGSSIDSTNIVASPSSGVRNDGTDYSTIAIKATYPDGSPAINEDIQWISDNGSLSTSVSSTDSDGETSVRLTNNNAGSSTVTARLENGESVSTTIDFKAPVLESIARNKSEIKSDNSERATLSARIRYMPEDIPANNGELVEWSTNRGSLDSSQSSTNTSGIATNRIRSSQAGTATITASYGGVSKSTTVNLIKPSETRFNSNNRVVECTGPGCSYASFSLGNTYYWNGSVISNPSAKGFVKETGNRKLITNGAYNGFPYTVYEFAITKN